MGDQEDLSSRDLFLLDRANKAKRRRERVQSGSSSTKKKGRTLGPLGPLGPLGLVPLAIPCRVIRDDDLGKIRVLHAVLEEKSHPASTPTPTPPQPLDVLIEVMEQEKLAVVVVPPLCDLMPAVAEAPLSVPAVAEAFPPVPAVAEAPLSVPAPKKESMFAKQYVSSRLDRMFGQDAAVQRAKTWYGTGEWKKKPLVLWGPCGTGKTLLCNLLAAFHQATCTLYEDELDVKDKIKGWLQGSRAAGLGLLAFTKEVHKPSWLLIDDLDSLEGECRREVITLLKPFMDAKGLKHFPAPVFITCENIHDKSVAALKSVAWPKSCVQLNPHTLSDLTRLARAVAPTVPSKLAEQVATLACGDARKCIMEARFARVLQSVPEFNREEKLYHSPFDAVKALIECPAVKSRALDGQEFMVQQLMYQNYPKFNSSIDVVSRVADAFSEFNLFEKDFEHGEYTELYLTYVIPKVCSGRVKKYDLKLAGNFVQKRGKCSLDQSLIEKALTRKILE
jgi:DNA polymerase III delta prime subunit